jgi:glycosyltransferase involved in cell wall biosynthesis
VSKDSAWPKISIITPSYNQALFIEETIRSVLLQGYPNLEYIVIDGGSRDGSVDIIRKYAQRLTYWVSEPDRGQSHAITKGFARASGEIVAWLNSDDIYLAGALAQVGRAFMDHSNAGLIFGRCRIIDEHSRRIGDVAAVAEFDLAAHLRDNQVPQPAAFARREVLKKVGLLRTDLNFTMDFELWIRIALDFPVVVLSEFWAAFRIHSKQKTFVGSRQWTNEVIQIYEALAHNPRLASPALSTSIREALASRLYERCFFSLEEGRKLPWLQDYLKSIRCNSSQVLALRKHARLFKLLCSTVAGRRRSSKPSLLDTSRAPR